MGDGDLEKRVLKSDFVTTTNLQLETNYFVSKLILLCTLLCNLYEKKFRYLDPDFTINGCGVLFANTVYALFIEITGLGKSLIHRLHNPVSQAFGASSRNLGFQLLTNPV